MHGNTGEHFTKLVAASDKNENKKNIYCWIWPRGYVSLFILGWNHFKKNTEVAKNQHIKPLVYWLENLHFHFQKCLCRCDLNRKFKMAAMMMTFLRGIPFSIWESRRQWNILNMSIKIWIANLSIGDENNCCQCRIFYHGASIWPCLPLCSPPLDFKHNWIWPLLRLERKSSKRVRFELDCKLIGPLCCLLGTGCKLIGSSCCLLGTGCKLIGPSCCLLGTGCKLIGSSCCLLGTGCKLIGSSCCLLGTGCKLIGPSCCLLGTGCKLIGSSCCLLGTGCKLIGPSCCLLGTGCKLIGPSCCLLGTGCKLIGSSCCLLGTGCKLIVPSCCLLGTGCKLIGPSCCLLGPYAACWLTWYNVCDCVTVCGSHCTICVILSRCVAHIVQCVW